MEDLLQAEVVEGVGFVGQMVGYNNDLHHTRREKSVPDPRSSKLCKEGWRHGWGVRGRGNIDWGTWLLVYCFKVECGSVVAMCSAMDDIAVQNKVNSRFCVLQSWFWMSRIIRMAYEVEHGWRRLECRGTLQTRALPLSSPKEKRSRPPKVVCICSMHICNLLCSVGGRPLPSLDSSNRNGLFE